MTTLAGGNGFTSPGSANGQGTFAKFSDVHGVAADASGNIFVADKSNNMIRRINASGGTSAHAGCLRSNIDWWQSCIFVSFWSCADFGEMLSFFYVLVN